MNLNSDIEIKDVVTVLSRHYDNKAGYKVSERDTYRIVYVTSGTAIYKFSHGEYKVSQGNIILLSPLEEYTLLSCGEKDWCFSAIAFRTSAEICNDKKIISVSEKSGIGDLFRQADNIWSSREKGFKMCVKGLLYMIFYKLICESSPAKTFRPEIMKSIDFIKSNYMKKISLGDMAKSSGYSISYFKRLFLKEIGMPPVKYLNNVRTEHAKELLQTNMFNVGEVARECGFENIYYFSAVFKKYTGVSPRRY